MKTAREIKEKYQSITKETCEGYQDEHILQAMEEHAKQVPLIKSIILREDQEASELIYGCMLADELNIQLRNDRLNLKNLQNVIRDLEEEIDERETEFKRLQEEFEKWKH